MNLIISFQPPKKRGNIASRQEHETWTKKNCKTREHKKGNIKLMLLQPAEKSR